ncbi:MAG TPA: enhanced serine sensitivity protein SseB C-terminal domain-containing protein [Candidatus Angelobacter sp.]|nr:enhanced serine sensitivity protein SseB C-terminal domain-containing protein [Candidatus Angelobacter sp.]
MSLRNIPVSRWSTCIRREDETNGGPSAPDAAQAGPPPANDAPDFANSPLPAAMLAVAHEDSPQNRQMLYQRMFQTWFVVPTKEAVPDQPGFSVVPANVADSLSLEHDSSGQPVAVAFTDEEALRNWQKTIPWIALQGTAFFQAVASTEAEEIVINPYEPENPESKMIRPGGIVKRWEFEELAEGRIPEGHSGKQVMEPQSVLVTMPQQMHAPEMFDAISAVARKFPEIASMYFGQVIYPDGEPHWAIAVEFAGAPSDKHLNRMMTALVKAAQRIFPKSVSADLLLASTSLGQSIKASGKKIY